jgi:TatA/E family protein of Tat protein translocase
MFSVPDIMVVSVLALLLFGPDQLPKIMRQAGRVMREVQNTSQSFIAEMERAADTNESAFPRREQHGGPLGESHADQPGQMDPTDRGPREAGGAEPRA